jgi:hypothetical protein
MREIRPSGSEGGVALTTPFLPLSMRLGFGMVAARRCTPGSIQAGHERSAAPFDWPGASRPPRGPGERAAFFSDSGTVAPPNPR